MTNISLSDWGLSVTQDALSFLSQDTEGESSKIPMKPDSVKKLLLECDFRHVPEGSFIPPILPEYHSDSTIVQLVKSVDISRPVGPEDEGDEEEESTEEDEQNRSQTVSRSAKRMLRLTFAVPGHSARLELVETARLQNLPENLVPGSKWLLRGPFRLVAGFYLLERSEQLRLVGGGVKRLTDGFNLNQDVKARRKDLTQEHGSSGPPKFVSFMDLKKQPKKKETSQAPAKPVVIAESVTARALPVTEVSSRVKELESGPRLAADTFAMKERKGGKGRGPRTSRRERDELLDQYKPPSRNAPQVMIRLDKVSNLQDAQRLHDAMAPPPEFPSTKSEGFAGYTGGNTGRQGNRNKGSRGKGKGSRDEGKGGKGGYSGTGGGKGRSRV
jgi:hypothetical protein